jgi:hypothetical protein
MLNGKTSHQENPTERQQMYFLTNLEKTEYWRFEEESVLINAVNKKEILFLTEKYSENFWHEIISRNEMNLMTLSKLFFKNVRKKKVDFENKYSANTIINEFFQRAGNPSHLLVFFDYKNSCITPASLIKEYWNNFFLPSDETMIVVANKTTSCLFSYEETFFVADKKEMTEFTKIINKKRGNKFNSPLSP